MNKKLRMSLKVSGVALAVSQAFAPNAMAQEEQKEGGSVVVVSGMRASARSSVAIKKDSMEVVDSITAEDIGKLPDPNVAETLTRIPGVQGYRYGGEGASPFGNGSGVIIRGLSGQTASQVNGRAFFTAGGREFNVESAIPGMISGIDVYKNPSAEHIEGGIGGLVNIRTRIPSDFKGPTVSLSSNLRYNDLAKETDPEVFGLFGNRWDLGGGRRIGFLIAGSLQKSTGRSDNNPGNRGANFKRAIRGDSAEYASLAAANTSGSLNQPNAAYVGRSDISFLTGVPTLPTSSTVGANTPNLAGLTADQINNIMTAPGLTNNAFQETIMRKREGLNLAADYRHSNTLRFFTEGHYNYYRYHQQYRGLNSADGNHVQNLRTTPFNFTEGLANRNINGGSDDVLVNKRLQSGDFLNSTLSTIGGNEYHPYETWVGVGGVEWSPTESLSLKADFTYIKSDRNKDNRSVNMVSGPGLTWTTHRVADGEPHQLNFSGPDLSNPANFVFRDYNNGSNEVWDDKGHAESLSGAYILDDGLFTKLKFGTRIATQQSLYKNFNFGGRPLTTNGSALAGNFSNAINGASIPGVMGNAPTNFLDGKAGYAGGFAVYDPSAVTGDQVRTAFPNAGILPEGSYVENQLSRRWFKENTRAGYLSSDFAAFNDRIKGNVGVRIVETKTTVTARVTDLTSATPTIVENTKTNSYTNYLPSFNMTGEITKDFLARFGYGRSMTRPDPGALNPSVSVNRADGTGSVGNEALRPQTADSFDISLERYFSPTNYVSAGIFHKKIKGFFSGVQECQTVAFAPAYSGSPTNGCTNGQYSITRNVNAEDGFARGIELAGQYFFDSGVLKNYGLAASYTYVDTSNPLNFGTPAAPRIVDTPQPMQSKNSVSVSGMYEDAKMSARIVYTWRSDSILFGAAANPIDGRTTGAYGIVDAAFNYNLTDNMTLSLNVSNLLNKGLDRYIGEPGAYMTDNQFQSYANGRIVALGLRVKFDK